MKKEEKIQLLINGNVRGDYQFKLTQGTDASPRFHQENQTVFSFDQRLRSEQYSSPE